MVLVPSAKVRGCARSPTSKVGAACAQRLGSGLGVLPSAEGISWAWCPKPGVGAGRKAQSRGSGLRAEPNVEGRHYYYYYHYYY